jgi:hypothetical protein
LLSGADVLLFGVLFADGAMAMLSLLLLTEQPDNNASRTKKEKKDAIALLI